MVLISFPAMNILVSSANSPVFVPMPILPNMKSKLLQKLRFKYNVVFISHSPKRF